MDYLCEEIVVEILARLPSKSLIRFMVICRLWKSIITSPQLSQLVSKRPDKTLVHTERECYTFLEDDENDLLGFETDFPLKNVLYRKYEVSNAHLLGSDNGLLCIGMRRNTKEEEAGSYRVIIWNPCIRRHVLVLDHPLDDHDYERAHGFGGTISGIDYKYVRIVAFKNVVADYPTVKAFEVYSLKTGKWRPRKYLDFELYRCKGFDSNVSLLRGRLHFILYERRDGVESNSIASFELEDEVLEDIMLPEDLYPCGQFSLKLALIQESQLAVVARDEDTEMPFFSMWVMKEYGYVNSWVKLFNIYLKSMIIGTSQKPSYQMMVHFLKNGTELLLGLRSIRRDYKKLPPRLVTYKLETRKTSHGLFSSYEFCGFTKFFKESLVLLGDHRAVADHRVLSMFISRPPSMIQIGYKPMWTEGLGFLQCPLFQDQCVYYYVWKGSHWLRFFL